MVETRANASEGSAKSSGGALLLRPKPRDLGEFSVLRLLPAPERQMVGPFIFFDHFGPAEFAPGEGINVRPHPHIGLATLTYLFEGEIFHRDSLGNARAIRPGAVNWMTAGRGIVHSEREQAEVKARPHRLHGIQSWIALPEEHEEDPPAFFHHGAEELPVFEIGGARLNLIIGRAYDRASPVKTFSPMYYLGVTAPKGAAFTVPEGFEDNAIYVAAGAMRTAGLAAEAGTMLVLPPGHKDRIEVSADLQAMLLGGTPLGRRHIEWNFVASTKERILRAKEDWRAGRFPKVPGDETEFIPLPGV